MIGTSYLMFLPTQCKLFDHRYYVCVRFQGDIPLSKEKKELRDTSRSSLYFHKNTLLVRLSKTLTTVPLRVVVTFDSSASPAVPSLNSPT
mmetsp:Transcript_313/g.410  ORF Transcript_313/g.410 Transcript_313/m.410 type:complete len:90 (-) Transcript_313:135-404(-)